jgi:hypothetical protein
MAATAEQVARFIARYRTEIAKSSVQKINQIIKHYEMAGIVTKENRELKRFRSRIARVVCNEEARYEELLAQDVLAQLYAIQGVKSVEVTNDETGEEDLVILIQVYYLYEGEIYDAGEWELNVCLDEVSSCNDISSYGYDKDFMFDDGTYFASDDYLFYTKLVGGIQEDAEDNPLYGNFCFGGLTKDIDDYLIAGEFVSAFQLISLCLHHVNEDDESKIPIYFDLMEGVNVRDLAEFFDLTEGEIAEYEAKNLTDGEGES